MKMKTFDTVAEQREALEAIAHTIETWWGPLAEKSFGDMSVPVKSDTAVLRMIASKLGV